MNVGCVDGGGARVIEITLPVRTPLSNQMARMHWAKRRKLGRAMAWKIRQAAGCHNGIPFHQCTVHIRWFTSRGRLPDRDGIIGGFKLVLDALVMRSKANPYGLGFIVDDGPAHVLKIEADPLRGPNKTEIIIREVVSDDKQ